MPLVTLRPATPEIEAGPLIAKPVTPPFPDKTYNSGKFLCHVLRMMWR